LRSDALDHISATGGFQWMRINYSLTAIQFIEDCGERRIAKPFVLVAGQESYAVSPQRVERILDLAKTAVNVGNREQLEKSKTTLICSNQLRGSVLVHLACNFARFVHVAEPYAGSGLRKHSRRNAGFLHFGQILFRSVVAPLIETWHRTGRVLSCQ